MTAMMSGQPQQSWIEKILTGPALATILVALVGQAMFSLVYQIVNNEQQSAAIALNVLSIKDLKEAVNDMRTPLSVRVFKLEDNVTNALIQNSAAHAEMSRRIDHTDRRIDQMDTIGTRALIVVANNQARVMMQIDRLAERMLMTDKRIGEVDLIKLQNEINVISQNIKRLEDRLERRQ